MAYTVIVPLVVARDESGKHQYLYAGAVVPGNVPADEVKRLAADGFIAKDPEPEPESGGEPRGNASRDEWAAYAATLGIEAPEGAKRDDIKALIEAAKGSTNKGGDTPPQE